MNAKQKRVVVIVAAGTLVVGASLMVQNTRAPKQAQKDEQRAAATQVKDVSLEQKLLEKGALASAQVQADAVKKLQAEVEAMKAENPAGVNPAGVVPSTSTGQLPPLPFAAPQQQGKAVTLPPPVPPPSSFSSAMPHSPSPGGEGVATPSVPPPPVEVEIGEIAVVSSGGAKKTVKTEGDASSAGSSDKKKDSASNAQKFFFPPSFMEAITLSGIDAPTGGAGKSNPVPILIKVKAPAVLPNDVRANLKGCFVLASGYGDLSTERVNLQLVSLSCMSRNGQAVIHQKVSGVVQDADGKPGLKGRVVSKMGAAIARSFLAGGLGGIGDAFKSTATTTSLSPLGATSAIDTANLKDVGMAGLGSGLSSGFKEAQKFYLDLAKQALPVIEVGALKKVGLITTDAIEIEIRQTGKRGAR